MRLEYGFIILIAAISWLPFSFAQYTPQFCFEDPDDLCGLKSGNATQVFQGILEPLESQVPGFAMIIFWGGIFAILWFKTENIMLLAIVGILFVASIGVTGSTIVISDTAVGIGLLLAASAVGFLLYQLIRQRVSLFS